MHFFRRDPEMLVRPLKSEASEEEKDTRNERVLQNTARSKRIIVLVRHGQYNDKVQVFRPIWQILSELLYGIKFKDTQDRIKVVVGPP